MKVAAWQNIQTLAGIVPAARIVPRVRLLSLGSKIVETTRVKLWPADHLYRVYFPDFIADVSPATRWLIWADPYEWVETSRIEAGIRLIGSNGLWATVEGVEAIGLSPAVSIHANPQMVRLGPAIAHG